MIKAEIIYEIAKSTGIEKNQVASVVEAFMKSVENSMVSKENVYLRGFGTFQVKHRASKKARNIGKNTTITIPAHHFPTFKPSKEFKESIKRNIK